MSCTIQTKSHSALPPSSFSKGLKPSHKSVVQITGHPFVFAILAILAIICQMNHPNGPLPSPRVSDLDTVSATELKNATAEILDSVRSRRAVVITRHDRPRAVLLSIEEYEALAHRDPPWLADLKDHYMGILEAMQAPEQKEAALRAFNATPEELGQAALEGAKRNKIGLFRDEL
jgi:antitoxin Phd